MSNRTAATTMNIVAPAPKVETATAEPVIFDEVESLAEPAKPVEAATAAPAKAVEPAETVDNPRKFAPSNVKRLVVNDEVYHGKTVGCPHP